MLKISNWSVRIDIQVNSGLTRMSDSSPVMMWSLDIGATWIHFTTAVIGSSKQLYLWEQEKAGIEDGGMGRYCIQTRWYCSISHKKWQLACIRAGSLFIFQFIYDIHALWFQRVSQFGNTPIVRRCLFVGNHMGTGHWSNVVLTHLWDEV